MQTRRISPVLRHAVRQWKVSICSDGSLGAPVRCHTVTVAPLGDQMLAREWGEVARRGSAGEAFGDLALRCADDDLVFANLETTIDGGDGLIPKESRLVAERATLADALDGIRVGVGVSSQNRTFDANPGGFLRVQELLEEPASFIWGTDRDAAEAARPLRVQRRGIRFGWLVAYATLHTFCVGAR